MPKKAAHPPAKKPAKGKAVAKKAPARAPRRAKKGVAKGKATRAAKPKKLPTKADLFVLEYLKDLNGAQAAIRAGYSPACARQTAYELLALPDVQAKVQGAMEQRAERVGIEADDVVRRIRDIAYSDPRELIELHRGCCRYCWGVNNRYQRTPREMDNDRAEYLRLTAEDRAAGKNVPEFNEAGGLGWNPKKDPNPSCPECFGDGEERVVAKDTRDLSPSAMALYAGVKTTQHGLEIKMVDRAGMLVKLGDHLGIFKRSVELTGKDGGPVQHASVAAVLDEIDGAGTGLPSHGTRGG